MKLTPSIDCACSMNWRSAEARGGLAAPALVHGDGHHRRPLVALAHELVEAPDQRLEEVARAREARVHEEARVVVGLGVRDHEDRRRAVAGLVVGQVVGAALGVVEEAAELVQDAARVLARPAARVPADRPAAEHALERLDRAPDRARSSSRVNVQASVQRQPWPSRSWSRSRIHSATAGFSSSATAAAGDGHRHVGGVEDAREPPHAGAAAELVVRLGAGIALRRLHAGVGVLAPAVVAVVAPGHGVLRARLVDEHEVDHDPGAAGPRDARRVAAVADEVARADGGRDVAGGLDRSCGPLQVAHDAAISAAARRMTGSGATVTRTMPGQAELGAAAHEDAAAHERVAHRDVVDAELDEHEVRLRRVRRRTRPPRARRPGPRARRPPRRAAARRSPGRRRRRCRRRARRG